MLPYFSGKATWSIHKEAAGCHNSAIFQWHQGESRDIHLFVFLLFSCVWVNDEYSLYLFVAVALDSLTGLQRLPPMLLWITKHIELAQITQITGWSGRLVVGQGVQNIFYT